MSSIELTVRRHLSKETQSSAEGLSELRLFCTKIEESSLNLKVREALEYRKQGHFDKAMLNIAQANRDQVIAIREIQDLIGHVSGVRYPKVVFEKFRPIEPFEIGISDADAVLSILADLTDVDNPLLKEDSLKLHDRELKKKNVEVYLQFLGDRVKGAEASEEGKETKESIAALALELTDLRNRILDKIFVVVGKFLNETSSGIERDRIFLKLAQNLFLVIVSPILTKPATQVETES